MRTHHTGFRTDVYLFYRFNIEPALRPILSRWQAILSSAMTTLAVFTLVGIGWAHGPHGDNETESLVNQSGARSAGVAVMMAGDRSSRNLPPEPLLWYDRRVLRSRHSVAARKKVKRTRAEIAREREKLLEATNREIDAIVADFHAQLPREEAESIGAIYCRYSSRFQSSIGDQVRTLFEEAHRLEIFVPREFVFFDMAVRGYQDRRPGLSTLRAAIKRKAFEVFMVFSTSRLFRRAYKALEFVEEELVDRGIRGIFLSSGIDTAKGENWRLVFQILCAMDEAMVRSIGSHVQISHEGLFIRGMVCTSLILGFTGEDVPGEFTKRKRPRQRIIIDPETAPWIEKIFNWYVVDGKSLDEIARELNDDDKASAPAKSLTGLWTHALVRKHLMNPCYRGYWCYGAKETKWSVGKDYARQIPRIKPLKTAQFDKLRIISDETWYRAQGLLAAERGNSGRKPKDGNRQKRPRLLRGLFVCPEHGRQLTVSGAYGQVLLCPLCRALKAEKRPLFTHLNRALALELTCQTLAEFVRADEALVAEIIAACQHELETAQRPDPEVVKRLKSQVKKLSSTIDFNRRNPGDTEEEQRQTEQVLKDLRRQRTNALADLAVQEAVDGKVITVPEPEEVVALLDELGEMLVASASAETEDQIRTARRIIDELTGGKIDLFQMGERKKCRGWLQGRFRVDVVSVVIGKLTGAHIASKDGARLEIIIDFRAPKLIDEQADEAKKLWDKGLLNKLIAQEMGLLPCYITKLIHFWHDERGLPRPDNHRRRAELERKQVKTPKYKEFAAKIVGLVEEGLSDLAIGRKIGVSGFTVAKAISWSFKSRDLPVPTAVDRRRTMLAKARAMLHDGMLIKDIAAELGYSPRALKLALVKYLADLGETMPDGRTRRGNATSGEPANGDPNRSQ